MRGGSIAAMGVHAQPADLKVGTTYGNCQPRSADLVVPTS
jgi:hypothetical protein